MFLRCEFCDYLKGSGFTDPRSGLYNRACCWGFFEPLQPIPDMNLLPFEVKEKRGWTLNSAGYLLGPHAIDNHRSFHEKPGLTGKRELPPEDEGRSGGFAGPLSENAAVRMLIEFLTFLRLKEAGALPDLPDLPSAVSAEDVEQP